jgi:hypothetical protein
MGSLLERYMAPDLVSYLEKHVQKHRAGFTIYKA